MGVFNVFMGEFNFADLPEADLMRSIRLFGEKVIPALRGLRAVLTSFRDAATMAASPGIDRMRCYCAFASSGCAFSRALLST